jgi:hypothetical protein
VTGKSAERGRRQGPFTNTERTPTEKSVWGIYNDIYIYIYIIYIIHAYMHKANSRWIGGLERSGNDLA